MGSLTAKKGNQTTLWVSDGLLVPRYGYGLCGYNGMVPWCCVVCALIVGLFLGVSLVAFARAVGGDYGLPLPCGMYGGSGLWFVLGIPCLWAWFIWLLSLLEYVGFCFGLMPIFLFIGEGLSVFR